MVKNQYIHIWRLGFWKAFWTTMRPYLIFVSGTAGLVGLAFIEDPNPLRVILAFIPLFFSYGLGQALTDCFQIDTDSLSSPYRPLVKGIISRRQVLIVSLSGLSLGVLILLLLNPFTLVPGTLAVFGLLMYTKLKRKWWGGPAWNSWIVALLPIIGRWTEIGYKSKVIEFNSLFTTPFVLVVLTVFFGYANFVVMGYFKDISADLKTGYNTFPVVFGWLPAAILSDVLALISAGLAASVLYSTRNMNISGIAIFAAASAVSLYAQIKIHRIRDEKKAHGPISNVVRVFILFGLSITVTLKEEWLVFLAVFYLLFELALKQRTEKTQV